MSVMLRAFQIVEQPPDRPIHGVVNWPTRESAIGLFGICPQEITVGVHDADFERNVLFQFCFLVMVINRCASHSSIAAGRSRLVGRNIRDEPFNFCVSVPALFGDPYEMTSQKFSHHKFLRSRAVRGFPELIYAHLGNCP